MQGDIIKTYDGNIITRTVNALGFCRSHQGGQHDAFQPGIQSISISTGDGENEAIQRTAGVSQIIRIILDGMVCII